MPSTEHDAVADLVTRQPALLVELAALVGVQLPTFDKMERGDTNLSRTSPLTLHADKVSVFRAADLTPIFALISEVQLKWDDDKPFAWLGYVASLRLTYRRTAARCCCSWSRCRRRSSGGRGARSSWAVGIPSARS